MTPAIAALIVTSPLILFVVMAVAFEVSDWAFERKTARLRAARRS